MKFSLRTISKRTALFATAFVLTFSTVTAALPFMLSQQVGASASVATADVVVEAGYAGAAGSIGGSGKPTYATIPAAAAGATTGQTIVVRDGVYNDATPTFTYLRIPQGKALKLRAENTHGAVINLPVVIKNTGGYVFDGFVVSNFVSDYGLWLDNTSTPTLESRITNNKITNISAENNHVEGIFVGDSAKTGSNIVIAGNEISNISSTTKGVSGIGVNGTVNGLSVQGNIISNLSSPVYARGINTTDHKVQGVVSDNVVYSSVPQPLFLPVIATVSGNVTIATPANAQLVTQTLGDVTLGWDASAKPSNFPVIPGNVTYEIRYGVDAADLNQSATATGTGAALTGLVSGTYYWQVRAVLGSSDASLWTATQSFVVDTTPAAPVVTAANADGALTNNSYTNKAPVTISWNAVDGATSYIYKSWTDVAGNPWNAANPYTFTTTDLSYNGAFNQGQGSYFTEVIAVNALGEESDPSVTFKATFDNSKPTVELLTPTTTLFNSVGTTLSVKATDNFAVQKVVANIYKDGSLYKSTQVTVAGTEIEATHSVDLGTVMNGAPLPTGNYSVRYNALDKAGNLSTTKTFSFSVDNTVPSTPVIVADSVFVKIGQVNKTLNWTHDLNDVVTYQYREYTSYANALADNSYWQKNIAAPILTTTDTASLTSTTLYWRVVAIDAVGNRSALSNIGKITIDRNAPTSTNNLADLVRGEVTVTQTVSDNFNPASGKLRIWKTKADNVTQDDTKFFALGDWAVNGSNQVEYTVDTVANLHGDGRYIAKFTSTDEAGNQSVSQKYFTVDNTEPTLTIKPESIGNGSTFRSVSFKLFDQYQIDKIVVNGVVKDLTNDQWSDLNGVVPGAFGAVEGDNEVILYDVAGNATTYEFALDLTAPAVAITTPGNAALVSGTVNLSATVTDANPSESYYEITGPGLVTPVTSSFSDGRSVHDFAWDTAGLNGVYTVTFTAVDATLTDTNKSSTSITLNVDNTAPVLSAITYTTTGNVITPNVTSDDEDATYLWEQLTGIEDGVTISDSEILTPNFTVLVDGTYSFRLTATDAAGNVSTRTFSFTYTTPAPVVDEEEEEEEDTPVTVALVETPIITTPGFANVAVLGDTTDEAAANGETKGATTDIAAQAVDADGNPTAFGMAWYWWLLIVAALAALAWWIAAAVRRRNAEEN